MRSSIVVYSFITRECKPGGIFQTGVYGFDGLQTREPGFVPGFDYDYVSPAGSQ